jgi:hypothetical protein
MLGEEIQVTNYIDALKILHENNDNYSILIDFHNRKKWITSNNITLTLISPENDSFVEEHIKDQKGKGRIGYYLIDTFDNSIKCIYDICGRYEYYSRGNKVGSLHLESFHISRNDHIRLFNKTAEVLVENGTNKEYYDSPNILSFEPNLRTTFYTDFIYRKRRKRVVKIITSDLFIIKNRSDGGRDIYDEETGKLCCVCNIGKRYEYYLLGEFNDHLSSVTPNTDNVLIKLIPNKERVWATEVTYIDPNNNPYIVRERNDGGVDLLSKRDNTLKYICNIGKRFYYIPFPESKNIL